ncbi:YfhO family protein, partial [Aegicerativicinus sediminis]
MAKQQNDFREKTGEETYWTNGAFGGMPTYQLGVKYPHNYIKKLDGALRFLPRPADYLFLYFLSFYVLMLVLKVDYRLAAFGSLAFGFSTYLIIILGVGHNSKAHAIAYMPLVLAGILLTFRKEYIKGFILATIALGLEIVANHFQMTYYLLLLVCVIGIVYLIDFYRKKELPHFFKSIGILSISALLAVGLNAGNILSTQEYVKESTRGNSELTINADGSPKDNTTGLSREYITEYSYGKLESLNLFIPRFMGGGTYSDVGKDSETYQFYLNAGLTPVQAIEQVKQTPTYWGDQTIVEAPAYVGAIVIFLAILALFLIKGRLKWWLSGGIVLSLFLSFGKNLAFLTDFFINVVPLYDKFRAVSSIQVILELCFPILAVFGLYKIFNKEISIDEKMKGLKWSTIIAGGIALIIWLFGSSLFDFAGVRDAMWRQNYGQAFMNALEEDRIMIMKSDAFRTLILVLLSAGVLWAVINDKIKKSIGISALFVLLLFDLIGVDRRHVNNENFVASVSVQRPYQVSQLDQQVLKDTSYFRVLDLTTQGARAPGRASYFYNSLTGYHAAKLGRYNDLMEFYIYRNNINVFNMLNTKYILAEDENGSQFPYVNNDANGNAWFVSEIREVASANEELQLLDSLDNKNIAITTMPLPSESKRNFQIDSLATINLKSVKPNELKYSYSNTNDGFAVFSEIYYPHGWQAYLDGEEMPHFRVDYLLRGMFVPAGKHEIVFKFDPQVVKTGGTIALASSIIVALLVLGGLFLMFKR